MDNVFSWNGKQTINLPEKPSMVFRSVHLCVFPETKLDFLRKCIRTCGEMKYSHIVLEFWGTLKFDCLKELSWEFAYTKDGIRPLIDEAKSYGMEIIPMFNHLGHASANREKYGKHVVLDQNPDLSYMFNTYGWEWDFENEEVYELLKKVRRELIDLCGEGKYFHIGCDEAYSIGYGENRALKLCEYINRVADEFSGEGRRAIIWGDMLLNKKDYENEEKRYYANIEDERISSDILNNLNKDVIIADWQYHQVCDTWKSAQKLKSYGFDIICCPWDNIDNVKSAVSTVKNENLFGIMHTTWHTLHTGFPTMVYAGLVSYSGDTNIIHRRELNFFTAHVVRNVMPSGGEYEKAGWCERVIGPGL